MNKLLIGALLLAVACKKAETPPPPAAAAPPAPGTPAFKIASARSAAPAEVSANATVMDGSPWDSVPGAQLAAGDNGWRCYPDNPATNGEDPICLDEQAQQWAAAFMARRPPHLTGMGIGYMLRGGVSASDTDPFKAAPDSGKPWIQDPPQIGIAMPNARSYVSLPTTRRPDGPWIKYAGTPYAYIVVPSGH